MICRAAIGYPKCEYCTAVREIGAVEAKNRLDTLLDRVEAGEEIVITRHGKPVARLVPNATKIDGPKVHSTLERFRRRAKNLKGRFDWADIKGIVLDSSATLAWVYSDEVTEGIRGVFARVGDHGAWVPGIWRLEVANILEMGVRRGRHDAPFRDATLEDLAQLPISVDAETDRQAWTVTIRLAQRHRLTSYDAADLELALRRGLPLATLDQELRHTAHWEGVALLGA